MYSCFLFCIGVKNISYTKGRYVDLWRPTVGVLRKLFGSEREEVTAGRRIFYDQFYNL